MGLEVRVEKVYGTNIGNNLNKYRSKYEISSTSTNSTQYFTGKQSFPKVRFADSSSIVLRRKPGLNFFK